MDSELSIDECIAISSNVDDGISSKSRCLACCKGFKDSSRPTFQRRISMVKRQVWPTNYFFKPGVIVMVGLPATGKSYMSKKLASYLNWTGVRSKIFNVGDYRRQVCGPYQSYNFFDPNNASFTKSREYVCDLAVKDAVDYLQKDQGQIAIFDATNTSRERRKHLIDVFQVEKKFDIFFVESICNDRKIVEANINGVKLDSPDYKFISKTLAMEDFHKRIEQYKKVYNTLDCIFDAKVPFIQIFDHGQRFVVNKMRGVVSSKIVKYLMNISVRPQAVYITRHGESIANLQNRIGLDTDLSDSGSRYARELADFINNSKIQNLKVYTSAKMRTLKTGQFINANKEAWPALNEIDAGIFNGLTYKEIETQFPKEFTDRRDNKFSYCYPNGESYQDMISRLEPVIMELERLENVLVICHNAVTRCLLAYFLDKQSDQIPHIKVKLHTVYKLTFNNKGGCKIETISFGNNNDGNGNILY